MRGFQIEIVETVIHKKWVTIDSPDIKTEEMAKLYVSEALENISFDDIKKFDKEEREVDLEVDNEDWEFWLAYRGDNE